LDLQWYMFFFCLSSTFRVVKVLRFMTLTSCLIWKWIYLVGAFERSKSGKKIKFIKNYYFHRKPIFDNIDFLFLYSFKAYNYRSLKFWPNAYHIIFHKQFMSMNTFWHIYSHEKCSNIFIIFEKLFIKHINEKVKLKFIWILNWFIICYLYLSGRNQYTDYISSTMIHYTKYYSVINSIPSWLK